MLIDINIFEDVLRQREGWSASRTVLKLVRQGRCEGWISALTVPILYFYRTRLHSEEESRRIAQGIVKGFKVIPLDDRILRKAFKSTLPDFEDNIQFFSALTKRVHYVITRNRRDYEQALIPVVTPEQFLDLDPTRTPWPQA